MTRNLGGHEVAAALRPTRPGWRDPRLWVGLLLVAGSVVAGSRVLAAADDSVTVWAAARDMGAGDQVAAGDLVARRVRFVDASDQERYFTADQEPAGLQLERGVGAGELLARTSVGTVGDGGLQQLPIAVDPEQVPPSVAAGSVVDVYLVPTTGHGGCAACDGRPVLSGVTVVSASAVADGFAEAGQRQLVLGVHGADASAFIKALAGDDSPAVTVVGRG